MSVTADGTGVVAHAGSVAVRLLADRTGLTGELSKALTRASFVPVHDRGRVLVDVAVMLAGGGEAIADIDVLRHQGQVLGLVAPPPTVWRALSELTPAGWPGPGPAATCGHSWSCRRRRSPGPTWGDVVLDVDATLVTAHSEKELARPTFKGGFG